ncbi:MAG: hypothetical protein Q9185_005408 [Variospora sp. 1 TL-2023]
MTDIPTPNEGRRSPTVCVEHLHNPLSSPPENLAGPSHARQSGRQAHGLPVDPYDGQSTDEGCSGEGILLEDSDDMVEPGLSTRPSGLSRSRLHSDDPQYNFEEEDHGDSVQEDRADMAVPGSSIRPSGMSQGALAADDPQYDPYEENDDEPSEVVEELEDNEVGLVGSVTDSIAPPPDVRLEENPPAVGNSTQLGQCISQNRPRALNNRYRRYLGRLCLNTGTSRLEADVTRSVPHVQSTICSLEMGHSYYEEPDIDVFAFALIVYCWLVVCKKRMQGAPPREGERLHVRFGAYFLAAYELLKTKLANVELEYVVLAMDYWEERTFDHQGRSIWTRQHWFAELEMEDVNEPCRRNGEADEFLETLRNRGVEFLARSLAKKEVEQQKSALTSMPDRRTFPWLVALMASIDPELLRAIIEGQIARKAEIPHTPLSDRLKRMMDNQDHQPSIYQNAICDREGMSPTPCQWHRICHLMQVYVDDDSVLGDELAAEVDQLIYPSCQWPVPVKAVEKSLRRYTEWDSFVYEGSLEHASGRRMIISEFADQLKVRLDEEVAKGRKHVPLVAPVVQVGFSDRVITRLWQHRHHKDSNYIMNLAQALFQHEYPDRFCLKQHIIFECFQPDQPWFGEILLTRLSQAYTERGSGFSHYGAGFSNGASWRQRPATDWHRFLQRAWADEGFKSRVAEVHRRTVAHQAEKKREKEEDEWLLKCVESFSAVVEAARQFVIARRMNE